MDIKNVTIFYGHSASNIGDLAINTGQVNLLRSIFPKAHLHVVLYTTKNNPYTSDAELSFGDDVNSYFYFYPSESKIPGYLSKPTLLLKHCDALTVDLIVSASGEHLFAYKNNPNKANLFWRTLPLVAAKMAGIKTIQLPSTIGPFEKKGSMDLMRNVLGFIDNFSVRDAHSISYLNTLKTTNNCYDTALLDPAFFCCLNDQHQEKATISSPKNHLAVVMRLENWGMRVAKAIRITSTQSFKKHAYQNSVAYQFTTYLCERYLKNSENTIVIYIQTIADEKLANYVCRHFEKTNYSTRIKSYRPRSVEDYLENISGAHSVVTSRFHAAILAFVVNVPAYAVYFEEHGHKMPGLFELIGEPNKCFSLSMGNIEATANTILQHMSGSQEWLVATLSKIDVLRTKTKEWLASTTYQTDTDREFALKQGVYQNLIAQYYNTRGIDIQNHKKRKPSRKYLIKQMVLQDIKFPLRWPSLVIKSLRCMLSDRKNIRTAKNIMSRIPIFKPTQSKQLKLLEYLNTEPTRPIIPERGRICYVLHNSLPYATGGYAIRTQGVAKGLKYYGYEVFGLTRPGFPIDVKQIDPSTVENHTEDRIFYYQRLLSPLRTGISTAQYMESIITEFEEFIFEARPVLILAASFYITALPALIVARRLGIPCIYEVRGLAEITRLSRDKDYKKTNDYYIRETMVAKTAMAADHVLTLTSQMRDELVRRGVNEEKISLLPNSCDTSKFRPQPRDHDLVDYLQLPPNLPVIGYIGTLVDYEGLDDLVEACGLLKQRGFKFRLLIIGSENTTIDTKGPITTQLEEIAKSTGLDDWLIMPGRVPHDKTPSYYSLIDIAPFPRKPWPVCEMVSPMKPLEALAMQKAVVVSSVAALSGMIAHGKTGLVFTKGSPISLADTLQRLIEDKKLRDDLAEQGFFYVNRERNWVESVGKITPIINKIISENRAKSSFG